MQASNTAANENKVLIWGKEGRMWAFPGKKVYYYGNAGTMGGNGRNRTSRTYTHYGIEAEIVTVTDKKVRIKISTGSSAGTEINVDHHRVETWHEPIKFSWE